MAKHIHLSAFNNKTVFSLAILVVLCPVFLFSASTVVSALDYQDSDFFTFWLAGHLVSTGQNPSNSQIWIDGHSRFGADWLPNPVFPYPLPLSILAVPIGLLPLRTAYITWIFLSEIFITISVFLLLSWYSFPQKKHLILPLLVSAFLFRPTLVTLRIGQLSALLLFILALTLFLWNHQKWWQGGILLALLILKPTLGLSIICFSSLWLLIHKKYSTILAMTTTIALLGIIGWLQDPDWIGKFLSVGKSKFAETFGYNPTMWGLAGVLCKQVQLCTAEIGSVLSIAIVLGLSYLIFSRSHLLSAPLMMSLVIPLSLLITPYIWAYDQILLIICLSVVVYLFSQKPYPYLPVALIPIMFSVFSLLLLYLAYRMGHDAYSALLPLMCFFMIWAKMPSSGLDAQVVSESQEQIK